MTVLDHFAIGTSALADGWDLFGGVLGGTWAYGGDSRGYWWGQLEFASGPKVELLTPTGGPDAAFLERFLAARGAGPHHFNFITADIEATLARVRALGIEPVQVNLDSDTWKEAFQEGRVGPPGGGQQLDLRSCGVTQLTPPETGGVAAVHPRSAQHPAE